MNKAREKGFTLVETLVALAILAAVVLAAYALLSQSARFAAAEQDRLIAGIIADNAMVEIVVRPAPPVRGREDSEEVEIAGRRWRVTRAAEEAGEDLLRVSVTVARAGDTQTLARIETLRAVQ